MYVAIVHLETPVADHESAKEIGLKSAPNYLAAKDKGLLMKYYLSGETSSGGIYLWKSREDAEAWYTPEWYKFMKETYSEPTVTFYDSVVQVDNINDRVLVDGEPLSDSISD